jgi:hypothetical protein
VPPPPTEFLDRIATTLGGLPGVFSTPQWGGRAYKVAIGSKPKLLAHVMPAKDGAGVTVEFKLPKDRARDAIEQYAWLNPHGFRTLAPAGWVEAKVSRKRQLGPLRKLLEESRSLLPAHEPEPEPEPSRGPRGHDAVADRKSVV